MNEHEHCLGRAQDYFAGRLGPGEAADWEAHRDACPACRALLDRWPHAAVVPDLRGPVLARLATARGAMRPSGAPARPGPRIRDFGAWALPAATLLALALLVTAFWRPERQWARLDSAYGDTCAVRLQGGRPCCAD